MMRLGSQATYELYVPQESRGVRHVESLGITVPLRASAELEAVHALEVLPVAREQDPACCDAHCRDHDHLVGHADRLPRLSTCWRISARFVEGTGRAARAAAPSWWRSGGVTRTLDRRMPAGAPRLD